MKSDRLLYKATALDKPANLSAEQPISEGSGLSSEGKGSENVSADQGNEKKNSALNNTTDTGKTSERGKRNDTATPQSTVSASKGTDLFGFEQGKGKKSPSEAKIEDARKLLKELKTAQDCLLVTFGYRQRKSSCFSVLSIRTNCGNSSKSRAFRY